MWRSGGGEYLAYRRNRTVGQVSDTRLSTGGHARLHLLDRVGLGSRHLLRRARLLVRFSHVILKVAQLRGDLNIIGR